MKKIISLFSLFILLFVNIVTPVTYAMDGEDTSSESVSESVDTTSDDDSSDAGDDSDSDAGSDDAGSDADSESSDDSSDADEGSSDETPEDGEESESSEVAEGTETDEEVSEDSISSTTASSSEEEIELVCKQEGAPENALYISRDGDQADENCKWECDDQYSLSEDGLSCIPVEKTDSKGNSEEEKLTCEIPENALKIETTEEKCEWECSEGFLKSEDGATCDEINFSKYKNEPSVAALCQRLGLDWEADKGDLAKLAGIEDYLGTREQNESIRLYLVDHVEEILKGKFDLQAEVVEKNKGFVYSDNVVLNAEEITGESKYQNITVNVLAPIGSFPEGTTLSINPITKKKELKEIENQIVDQQNNVDEALELLAFDISFFYDGKEVQPVEGKTVQVSFDYADNKKLSDADINEEQELKVFHLNDKDDNGNKVDEVKVEEVKLNAEDSEEGKLVVDAEGFSVYVLTITVVSDKKILKLDPNGGILDEEGWVKNDNFSATMNEDYYFKSFASENFEVKLPGAVKTGSIFKGWYDNSENTRIGGKGDIITLNDDNTKLRARWSTGSVVAMIGDTEYDNFVDAITGANAGDTILILDDIILNSGVYFDKKITLNLNGHTISTKSENYSEDYVLDVVWGGDLTITGSGTIDGSNVMVGIKQTIANIGNSNNAARLTIENGTIIGKTYGISGNGNRHNTELTINGGEIKCVDENDCTAIYIPQNGKTEINGGEISGKSAAIEIRAGNLKINGGVFEASNQSYSCQGNGNGTTTNGAAIAVAQHTTKLDLNVIINNGEFNGVGVFSICNPQGNDQPIPTIEITGGVFSGIVKNTDNRIKSFIKGGTFTSSPDNDYVAEGYVISGEDNHTVIYAPVAEVMVGGNLIGGYSSIRSAFAAVKNIDEQSDEISVVLKRNAVFNKLYWGDNLEVNKKLTLDLSGYTLDVNCDHGNNQNGCIQVKDNLTIKNGKIEDKTPEDDFTYAIYLEENAVLNLKDIQLRGSRNVFNNALIKVNNGTLNINSSSFISSKNFCIEALGSSIVTINGESSFTSNISHETWNNAINMHIPYTKAIITGGKIDIFSDEGNKLFNDNDVSIFEVKGGTFNKDPSHYACSGCFVAVKDGLYTVTESAETAGNYVAAPETSVSGSGIDANSTLKNLTVEVEENEGTGATITADILSGSDNSTLLGQVVLTFKKGDEVIENVKLGHTILVRIPVSGDFENVVILADHGDGFGTVGLATADSTCTAEGEASNNQYTGGLIPVQNGYASIYTCQASIFDAVGTYYNATLISDGADSEGTKKLYYAYGTNKYYTDDNDESSILSGKAIDTPSKNGYEFIGYFSGNTKVISETGLIIDSEFNVAANNTYIAKYNKGLHAFSYAEISSGTYNNGSSIAGNKNYNDEIVLKAPINIDSDYEFNGWSLFSGTVADENDVTTIINPTCNANNAKCTFNMPNYDVVAKAKIEKKEYTITFDSNGGTEVAAQTGIAYGHTGTLPANPIYSGFGFIGWTLNGESFDIETTPITGNITLVADWKANNENQFYTMSGTSFTIVLYDDGNIDYTTTKLKNGLSTNQQLAAFLFGNKATTLTPAQISALFYTTKAEIVSIPDLGGAVLFLNYASGSTYPTKGFCSNSGCNYFASKTWNTTGTLPSMDTEKAVGPTWMDGATNYGKYMEIEGSGYVVHASTGNYNGYIYVPYKSFTVDYSYSNNPYWAEGLPISGTYKYKDDVTVADLPTAQGFTFTGWFLDGELTGSFSMPAKDVVLTGEFLGNDSDYGYHYELETLEGNWETTGTRIPLNGKEGDIFNFPSELPTFEGFSLTGDYSGLVIRSGFDLPIKYERNSYTVNYVYENSVPGVSSLPASGTYKYEESVPVAPLATASGYDFEWSGYTAGGSFNMPSNDVTITGKFIPRNDTKYLVRYYFENEVKTGWVIDNTKTQTFTGITEETASVTAPEFLGFTYNESKSSPSKVIEGSGATVLRLYYDRNEIKINFVDGSGTIAEEVYTGNYNTSLKKGFPAWIKTGYTLSWSESLPTKFPAEDMTITASWSANDIDYRIYNHIERITNNGYTARKDSSYKDGSGKVATVIEVPMELTGLTLNTGHENAVPCEVDGDVCKITIPDNATSGMKIDVYYKRNPITITFDSDGGSDVKSITKKYEYTLSGEIPEAPTKTGYVFSGWLLPNNEVVANLNGYQLTEDVTLTGIWTESDETPYKVEHYVENLDGTGFDLADTDNLTGTTNADTAAVARDFTGFTLSGEVVKQPIAATGSTVVRIEYKRNSYHVNYAINGTIPDGATGIPTSGEYKYEEPVTVANGASATGYTFTGWFLDDELTGSFAMPANDVVLTGEFAANNIAYKYHYELEDLNGNYVSTGTAVTGTGKTGEPISIIGELPTFTGFTLSGSVSDYTGTTINGDGSTDVAILYNRNSYSVKYAYSGTLTSTPTPLPHDVEYKYEQEVTVEDAATASGYKFNGWSGYTAGQTFNMPANDVIITGSFKPIKGTEYTVEYYYQANDGEFYLSGSEVRTGRTEKIAKINSGDKVPSDTEHFKYDKTNTGNILTGTINGDGSLVLKVYFKGLYSVTYNKGDHGAFSEWSKTGYNYGKATPSYQDLLDYHEEGYTFIGWSPEWQPTITGDVVYVAQWAPSEASYKVEYYKESLTGDYEKVATESFTGNTTEVVTGTINTYSGFTYSGDLSTLTGEIKGDGSLTLALYYTRDSYTLKYKDPNGIDIEKAVKYGADIPAETTEYEGYVFSGFSDAPASMPSSDLEITAIWNLKQYTVSFDENGGAAVEDMTYTIENGISTGSLPTPIWTGYEFTGWFDSNDVKVEFISTGTTGDITLTAKWNALEAEYKVTHYKEVWEGYNNAIKVDEKWYKVDKSSTGLDLVNTPISVEPKLYSGFTFDITAANVTSGNVAADGSLELKLYYKRNVYEVSFNTSGGNTITGQEVGYYRPIEIPADPIKTGYTFKEWQLNGVTFTGDDWKQLKTPGNIEIVATWTANNYSVKFDTNGASGNIDQIDTQYDVEIVLPNPTEEQLSKTGYTFTGWSIISGGNIDYTGGSLVSGLTDANEITLYPVWEAKTYTITWKNSDGSIIKTGSYAYDTIPELGFTPVDPAENVKCDFKGWTGTVEKVSGDAEYTAEYDNHSCSIAQYKVSWLNSDGTLINENQVAYGTKASYTGEVPTSGENIQYHYEFTGWILSGDTEETVLKDTELPNVESDLTFIAAYDSVLNNYTITFVYTGDNGFVTETGSYAYGTQTGDLAIPEVTGYVDDINVHNFSGWTPELAKVEGDATYTAVYNQVLRNYIVTWNIGGEETPITGEYSYQGKMVVPENPTRTGYTFSNWEAQDNAPEAKNGEYVKGDYTYVAKWNANTYKIEFNPNGGNGAAVLQDMTYDLTGTLTGNTFERNGYEFTGWSETESGVVKYADNAEVINLASTGIVKLYAQRSALDYTVKYNVNSGTMPETYTGKYSILTGIDSLAEPTRTGYVFSGWFDNEELTGDKVESISSGLSGDSELWAKWTPITYTIVFDKNENEATGTIENIVAEYDSGVNLPETGFTWTGYYINEWNTESNGSGTSYNPGDAVMNLTGVDGAEVKLYAQWMSQYTITVSFDTNGGTGIEPTTGIYNTIFEAPTNNPTKTGYNFSGWTLNGEPFDFSTKITGDIILTGVWSVINYPIYYTLNSGDNNTGNVNSYTVEDKVPLYNATRSGYVFEGWYSGDNKINSIEKGTTGTGYLTAQWKLVSEAINESKSGDKHPVVSSDVEIDVVAATGDADYITGGSIPSGTGILLSTVVGSGIVETYSLVGIETTSPSELNVKAEDLVTKTGYVASIVGGLDVFIKKITTDTDGNIIKTERNTASVNFSKPIALPIHIKTSATNVEIRVNHGDGYGLSGLSTDPNTTCTNGIASIPYTGGLIPVENSYAWIYTCSASAFVAYTEAPKSSGGGTSGGSTGGGGGGGGSSYSSSTSNSSTSNSTIKTPSASDINLSGKIEEPNKACLYVSEEAKIKYSDESLEAYSWAYANGVVSTDDVDVAKVYRYITRAELAKIMVQYVAGVLHRSPIVEENANYSDVDSSLGIYANYINLAYQYQLMGINADGTPLKEFNPAGLVTRGEFASVLSRVIYGDKYNVDGTSFYSMHIDVLNQAGVLDNTNPSILEKIEWVLLMLKRASKDLPNAKKASDVKICPISPEDEQKAAYEWALKYGITSIDDPYAARLSDGLTRAEFAKMMVQYMINVLHKKPILNKDVDYIDVDGSLGDLEGYIKLAYQYQIMGIHGNGEPLTEFEPNRILTRKEFATVFSRILFGDKYNIDGREYWTNHIKALKEISVLTNGDPALLEVRGWVMLMMYRSAEDAKNVNI